MSAASVILESLGESLPNRLNHRRENRKKVRLNASIVTADGIANCKVTDISQSGCRLQLCQPLALHQYLALEAKVNETDGLHIPLAQVRWAKNLIVGVEFVYASL